MVASGRWEKISTTSADVKMRRVSASAFSRVEAAAATAAVFAAAETETEDPAMSWGGTGEGYVSPGSILARSSCAAQAGTGVSALCRRPDPRSGALSDPSQHFSQAILLERWSVVVSGVSVPAATASSSLAARRGSFAPLDPAYPP